MQQTSAPDDRLSALTVTEKQLIRECMAGTISALLDQAEAEGGIKPEILDEAVRLAQTAARLEMDAARSLSVPHPADETGDDVWLSRLEDAVRDLEVTA